MYFIYVCTTICIYDIQYITNNDEIIVRPPD